MRNYEKIHHIREIENERSHLNKIRSLRYIYKSCVFDFNEFLANLQITFKIIPVRTCVLEKNKNDGKLNAKIVSNKIDENEEH